MWNTIYLQLMRLPVLNFFYLKRAAKLVKSAKIVIAICQGNTCRSPFIVASLRQSAHSHHVKLPLIISRGLSKAEGEPSSQIACESANEYSVDLSGHTAKSIYSETPKVDCVYLVVEPKHVVELTKWHGRASKIIYLGLLSSHKPTPGIPDPYGTDRAIYDQTYKRIHQATERLVVAIRKMQQ